MRPGQLVKQWPQRVAEVRHTINDIESSDARLPGSGRLQVREQGAREAQQGQNALMYWHQFSQDGDGLLVLGEG